MTSPISSSNSKRSLASSSRIVALVLAVAAVCLLAVGIAVAQSATFNVTVSGSSDYTVNGSPDPTLVLIRGRQYAFTVNAPGHPFYIKTSPVTGTGSTYNDGVINNGATAATVSFNVPANAPSPLYYQCSVHGAMSGVLQIVNAPPVPSGSASYTFLLIAALLLMASGLLWLGPTRNARSH